MLFIFLPLSYLWPQVNLFEFRNIPILSFPETIIANEGYPDYIMLNTKINKK
jgi:hypothetical protein